MTKGPKSKSVYNPPLHEQVPLPVELAEHFGLIPKKGQPTELQLEAPLPQNFLRINDGGYPHPHPQRIPVPGKPENVHADRLQRYLRQPGKNGGQSKEGQTETVLTLPAMEPQQNPELIIKNIWMFIAAALMATTVTALAISRAATNTAERNERCKSTLLEHLNNYPWKGSQVAQELQNVTPCKAIQVLSKRVNLMCKNVLNPSEAEAPSLNQAGDTSNGEEAVRSVFVPNPRLMTTAYCYKYAPKFGDGKGKKKR